MAGLGVQESLRTGETAVAPERHGAPSLARSFFVWGAAIYVLTTLAVVAVAVLRTDGHLVYVIDDPAIHLSVAQNLADHGTWGVVPGEFQSASSSPLWTVLLAAWIKVVPGPVALAPLALNVAAGLGVIAAIAANQRVLQPGRRRPLDVLAVVALVDVILFLPGLAMTGMEHTLHIALLLPAVALLHADATGRPRAGPPWLPYLLLGLATLTRFETLFVAVAIGVALLVAPPPGVGDRPGARVRGPALAVLSSLVPLAMFCLFNRLMGQGWLPNSVSAKAATNGSTPAGTIEQAFTRFGEDPLVAGLAGVAAVGLILAWRQRTAWTFPAMVLVASVGLHMLFARIGWYHRYQAYLIALGVYLVLWLIADQLPASRLPPARAFAAAGLVGVLLLFSGNKPSATVRAYDAAAQTYEQRYQAARFLSRYYQGRPIATGELGYISLFHDGHLTDVFGLGDYEVLQAWRGPNEPPGQDFWRDIAERRGFEVVVVYPITLYRHVPDTWISVGTWDLDRAVTTAYEAELEFFATTPEAVDPLLDHLREFEQELPAGVITRLNPLAELRADELSRGAA